VSFVHAFFRGEEVSDVEVLFLCVSEGQQTLLNRFGSSFLVGSFLCIKSSNFLGSLAKVRFIIQVQLSSSACFDTGFQFESFIIPQVASSLYFIQVTIGTF